LELLNQCLQLEGRLEKNDCKHAYLRIYKTENNQLRESSAKMERDFMNDMNEIVIKMKEMDRDYTEKLEERDDKIERLEEELKLLKVAKNLDNISTIDNISLMGSVSGASSSVTNSR
jgi:archaellum component FlaC